MAQPSYRRGQYETKEGTKECMQEHIKREIWVIWKFFKSSFYWYSIERRKKLLLALGRKCLKLDQTKELFPLNENIDTLKLRTRGKYRVTETNTERFKNSTVPCIQRMLNENKWESSNW